MDWYPLYNSLRIAVISGVIVFFLGIFAAYYVAKLPRWLKGVLSGYAQVCACIGRPHPVPDGPPNHGRYPP